jgi:hypothetical protein
MTMTLAQRNMQVVMTKEERQAKQAKFFSTLQDGMGARYVVQRHATTLFLLHP